MIVARMAVYGMYWKFLGTVPDLGVKSSMTYARERFGAEVVSLVPILELTGE